MLLDQSGIRQQINSTLKQVECGAALGRDAERKPLITSVGIAYEICADPSEVGIPRFVVLVQTHKHNIMIGQALIYPPALEAEMDDFFIKSTTA